jgi:hypothetical protein
MGYAHYEITRPDGTTIEAGHAVTGPCAREDCTEQTSRGTGSLCGTTPGRPDDLGCGNFYCDTHLHVTGAPAPEYLCTGCATKSGACGETACTCTCGQDHDCRCGCPR